MTHGERRVTKPIAARSCRKNDGTPMALSKDAAEKYVGQQVYRSLGIVCERYRTEVIYKDGDTRLIAVQFYTEGAGAAGGSFCVYCVAGTVCSSTNRMGSGYDYEEVLPELKALFGL